MTLVRYAVRRAKGTQRIRGARFVAQGETPGGRKIELLRSRNKLPALAKARQEIRQTTAGAANAGAVEVSPGSQNSGGPPTWKNSSLRENEILIVE